MDEYKEAEIDFLSKNEVSSSKSGDQNIDISYDTAIFHFMESFNQQNLQECLEIIHIILQAMANIHENDISCFITSGVMVQFFDVLEWDIDVNNQTYELILCVIQVIEKLISFTNFQFAHSLIYHDIITHLVSIIAKHDYKTIVPCLKCLRSLIQADCSHAVPVLLNVAPIEFYSEILQSDADTIPEQSVQEIINLLYDMLNSGFLTVDVPQFHDIYTNEEQENNEEQPPQPNPQENVQQEENQEIQEEDLPVEVLEQLPPKPQFVPKSVHKLDVMEEEKRIKEKFSSSDDEVKDDSSASGDGEIDEPVDISIQPIQLPPKPAENEDIIKSFFELFEEIFSLKEDNYKLIALQGFKSLFHRDPRFWSDKIFDVMLEGKFYNELSSPSYRVRNASIKLLITIFKRRKTNGPLSTKIVVDNLLVPEDNPEDQSENWPKNSIASDTTKLIKTMIENDPKKRKNFINDGYYDILNEVLGKSSFALKKLLLISLVDVTNSYRDDKTYIIRKAFESGMKPYFIEALQLPEQRYAALSAELLMRMIYAYNTYAENVVTKSFTDEDRTIIIDLINDDELSDDYVEMLIKLNNLIGGDGESSDSDSGTGMFNF